VREGVLKVLRVTVHYGTAEAVKDVSFEVEKGVVAAIIGPNGSGKSTILKAVAGLVPISKGEISYKGRRISGLPPHEIVKLGVVLVPEGRGLFPYMSVMANLRLGAFLRKDRDSVESDLKRIFDRFPILKERQSQKAGTLSGGEQAILSIARALMSRPQILMLDEPSLGLSPIVIDRLIDIINEISSSGISILLVEQNADVVMATAKNTYVLELGRIILEGPTQELLNERAVQKAFFGESE
jgi:branched-chain amino acid transport system ATP-binding protein